MVLNQLMKFYSLEQMKKSFILILIEDPPNC